MLGNETAVSLNACKLGSRLFSIDQTIHRRPPEQLPGYHNNKHNNGVQYCYLRQVVWEGDTIEMQGLTIDQLFSTCT